MRSLCYPKILLVCLLLWVFLTETCVNASSRKRLSFFFHASRGSHGEAVDARKYSLSKSSFSALGEIVTRQMLVWKTNCSGRVVHHAHLIADLHYHDIRSCCSDCLMASSSLLLATLDVRHPFLINPLLLFLCNSVSRLLSHTNNVRERMCNNTTRITHKICIIDPLPRHVTEGEITHTACVR